MVAHTHSVSHNAHVLGFYASILMVMLTVITFGIAILTPPISGANCTDDCIEYPYLDITSRFPRDYWWMFPAMVLTALVVVWMTCIHAWAPEGKKVFSQIALSFGIIAAAILIVDYFLQTYVIQSSLDNGETQGIPLLTQYNPHGVFIALEEIGYLMMGVAFLSMAPVFSKTDRVERGIRRIFGLSFALILIAVIAITIAYGINRQDRLEVAVISIDWLVLLANGILVSIVFRRAMRNTDSS